MELSEIKKMTGFFHDGTIDHIEQVGKNIYIWMESAQMEPEWIEKYHVQVNQSNYIKGVLHFINVKTLTVNDVELSNYEMRFLYAEILDLDVYEDNVTFIVTCKKWINDKRLDEFQKIVIHADRVFWEYDEYISASKEQKFESSYNPTELG